MIPIPSSFHIIEPHIFSCHVKVKVKSCRTLCDPTEVYQASPSVGFSRQEYWSGLPFPAPGDLPNTGIIPGSPAWQADSSPTKPPVRPYEIKKDIYLLSSVQFSCSVLSDSLQPHELQHARPPCPSPTPRVRSNSRPLSQWCHPAISSSVVPFYSCPQSLPASRSFPMSQLFAWDGQSIGVSACSISPSNEHPGLISLRMDWLDLLAVQGTLKSLLQHHSSKASILLRSAFFIVQISHPYMTTGKTIALTRQTFVGKIISLLFNMLSRLVITFLPRSKSLLI